jgi:hypothetical protein
MQINRVIAELPRHYQLDAGRRVDMVYQGRNGFVKIGIVTAFNDYYLACDLRGCSYARK